MNIAGKRRIAGVNFPNALMNGAYIFSKTIEDIETLAESDSGAIVVGSISIKPRPKNPGQNYWLHKERFFSLNSYGLPNGGIPYFKEALPKMVEIAHARNKPLIANIVGFSPDEFSELTKFVEQCGVDMVELNIGCPNVWDKGKQKRIISYHPSLVKASLSAVRKQKPTVPICVKISPLPPDILDEVIKVIVESGIVQVITATNSYPNAAVTSGAGDGKINDKLLTGLAGRALKPISLGVVEQLKATLPKHIQIIGCGGISTATDVKDYLQMGASAVQISTTLEDDGPSIFGKILYQA